MPCPVTGQKQCHCKCPNILSSIARRHGTSLDESSDANRDHYECMKSELCCDFQNEQFTKADQLCSSMGKPFHESTT